MRLRWPCTAARRRGSPIGSRVLKASREPYTGTLGASGPRSSVGSAIRHPWREPRPDATTERSTRCHGFHCQPKWENPAAGLAKRRKHVNHAADTPIKPATVLRRSPQPDCGFPPLRCSSRFKLAADSDQACKRLHGLFAPPWKLARPRPPCSAEVSAGARSLRAFAAAITLQAGSMRVRHVPFAQSRVYGVPAAPRTINLDQPRSQGRSSRVCRVPAVRRRLATIKARRRQSPSAVLGDAQSVQAVQVPAAPDAFNLAQSVPRTIKPCYFSACRRSRIPRRRRYRIPACRRSQGSCRCHCRLRSPRPCLCGLRPDC